MQKVENYRRHSEECRTMAGRARSPQEREMLLNMARTWDDLAAHRAEQIARKKRLEEIEAGPTNGRSRGSIPIDRLNASNDE
jgi:hypothetical protein